MSLQRAFFFPGGGCESGVVRSVLRKRHLVAATMLGTLVMGDLAYAQPQSPVPVKAKSQSSDRQERKAPVAGHVAENDESISVYADRTKAPGGGMMRVETAARSIQSVTESYISMQSPTSAPLDLVSNLPSVNVSSSDPSGIDGSAISSRGLNDNDIGFLMNGMPIANGSTASASSFIQNYIDSQNISVESMSPGSISVEDPLTSAAAGALSITTRTPSNKFGGTISGSYGSFNTSREFVRVDTGLLGNSGVKSYISLSHTRADAWRGSGVSDRKHLDFRAQKTIGARSSIDFFLGYNHYTSYLNRYPTLVSFENDKHGRPVATPLSYPAEFNPLSPSSYYALRGTDKDQFYASLPIKMALNHIFSLDVVPYYQRAMITLNSASRLTEGSTYSGTQAQVIDLNGDGRIRTSTRFDVGTAAMSVNQQGGVVASLHWHLKDNAGQVGYWHEENTYSLRTPMVPLDQTTGAVPSTDKSAYYRDPSGSIYYSTNYVGSYSLNAGFLEDTAYFLNHRMSLTGGIKVTSMTLTGTDYLPGGLGRSSQTLVSPTPRLSWSYNIDSRNQVYINAEGDFRAPSPVGLITRYSTSTGKMTTSGANVKPQYSIKEELGYRYSGDFLVADISAFNFNVTNRLLTLNTYSNDVQVSQTMNAGGETIRGVDVMLSTRPLLKRFRPYVSFEYLHATMDNNLPTTTVDGGMDYLRTQGKRPIMTPKYMASVGLTYNEGPFFLNATLHYTGQQYSTFMNDQAMPSYFTNSIALGYHFPTMWIAKSPTFRLNFSNVTGQNKLGGVYAFSNNAKSTVGVNGHAIAADSAPTYSPMPPFSMMGTLSTSF
ncbi:TonB-dependent receptor [Gluconacetobacter azotocaptans]|nr:TonB-dependent receptor [Gluconacetobacter azotocaptans]